MKTFLLLAAYLLFQQPCRAEQIELVIGQEVSATAHAKLKQLDMLGSGSDIFNRLPAPSIFIDQTEYVSENRQFVVAIEVTRDPLHIEGKPLLSKVYFSNEGKCASSQKNDKWKWLDVEKVVIDTKTWTAFAERVKQVAE